MFYRDERLALFIDGSNLYSAAKALGFDIRHFWKMTSIRRSALWLIGSITTASRW